MHWTHLGGVRSSLGLCGCGSTALVCCRSPPLTTWTEVTTGIVSCIVIKQREMERELGIISKSWICISSDSVNMNCFFQSLKRNCIVSKSWNVNCVCQHELDPCHEHQAGMRWLHHEYGQERQHSSAARAGVVEYNQQKLRLSVSTSPGIKWDVLSSAASFKAIVIYVVDSRIHPYCGYRHRGTIEAEGWVMAVG